MKGKLHVLKMVNDIGRAALSGEHETRAGSRATEPLECYGKVLSVESFMKEDVPRYASGCLYVFLGCGGS